MDQIDSRTIYLVIIAAVAAQRLVELRIASRNEKKLRAMGAREAGASHYPMIVALHTAFLIACPLEVYAFDRPFVPLIGFLSLAFLLDATLLRYWTIRTLGERWTTRIIYLPDSEVITGGPFRWLRHPNYLAVMLETIALPMLHTAWLTALIFGSLNALLLLKRVRTEEEALRRHTDYDAAFARRRVEAFGGGDE